MAVVAIWRESMDYIKESGDIFINGAKTFAETLFETKNSKPRKGTSIN